MQISFSTNSIHGLSRIGSESNGVLGRGGYGITLDGETFFPGNALEGYGQGAFDRTAAAGRFMKLLRDCDQGGTIIHAMRAPRLRWDTKRTDLNSLMLQIGQECIRVCAGTAKGTEKELVIQPLFSGISKSDLWNDNRCYYTALGQLAKESGVRILLENQCACINGHLVRGVCSDAAMAAEWIDTLNREVGEEIFGFCLDTGVCSLCRQDMGEMAAVLEKRIRAVLVRECDGVKEASRLPFTGRNADGQHMEWQGLTRELRRIAFDGILIMDAGDTLKGFSHLLRPQVFALICSVAEYLKWQIGMEQCIGKYRRRVLFGAGHMGRRYMACYGAKYPPLFISDNNPCLWGTKVCGVEVKAPAALKNLPEDCVVIICNTFYEEVAKQLKAMGVRRIGTFSDECLPAGCYEGE